MPERDKSGNNGRSKEVLSVLNKAIYASVYALRLRDPEGKSDALDEASKAKISLGEYIANIPEETLREIIEANNDNG